MADLAIVLARAFAATRIVIALEEQAARYPTGSAVFQFIGVHVLTSPRSMWPAQ